MTSASKPLLNGPSPAPLRVASIGECMVELAPTGEAGNFKQSFAGDTFNTLWYLRQIGPDWQARYVSRVGMDAMSEGMVEMMQRAGVEVDHVQRDPTRTPGLYLISLKDGERSFAYWRSQSAARHLVDDQSLIADATRDADVVFFSGITLAILEPAARGNLLHALEGARGAGKTIVFDPNLRPRLWPDPASMREAITAGAGVSDMVLPSFDEEAEHFGDAGMDATMARYLSAGVKTVVIKNADGPVHYSHQGTAGMVAPDSVAEVVDSTSAGDSFNAGLMAGLGHFADIQDAVRLACRVAGQVIGRKGALCTLDIDPLTGG